MVEDFDQLVVGARLGQQFGGRGQRLAGPGRGAEPRLRVRLQKRGHDLPQRFGYALGRGGVPFSAKYSIRALASGLAPSSR